MVFVLPQVPTFGQQLGPILSQAAGQLAEGYQKGRARAAWERLIMPQQHQPIMAADQIDQVAQQNSGQSSNSAPGVAQMQQIAQQTPSNPGKSLIQQWIDQPGGISVDQAQHIYDAAEANQKGSGKVLLDQIHNQQMMAQKQAIQGEKQATEAFKITQPYREKLLDAYEGYNSTNMKLNRMEQLNKEGKLTTPLIAKLSDELGFPLSVLANPESEEYQKLSQDLLSNITKYFGNKILQVEVENFLKTIPTLANSKEGREKIIANMRILMEPQKLAYEAYKDIRKQGGKLPLDLHEQVLERIDPKLNKLADKFKKSSNEFSGLPPADKYKGQRVENIETGEILESDGKAWNPFGGK